MNRLLWLTIAVIAAACIGCGQPEEHGCFAAVDAQGWRYGDTLHLSFEPSGEDSIAEGRLAVVVRHSAAYAYSNIWLEVSYPPADSMKADTFNIRLADNYGNWFGKGLGLSYQLTDSTKRNLSLKTPSELSVRHIMRVDRLSDIEQIGLLLLPD